MSTGTELTGVITTGSEADADLSLMSAMNFCNPFDHILPPPNDGSVDAADCNMLLGLYSDITLNNPTTPTTTVLNFGRGFNRGFARGLAGGYA